MCFCHENWTRQLTTAGDGDDDGNGLSTHKNNADRQINQPTTVSNGTTKTIAAASSVAAAAAPSPPSKRSKQ